KRCRAIGRVQPSIRLKRNATTAAVTMTGTRTRSPAVRWRLTRKAIDGADLIGGAPVQSRDDHRPEAPRPPRAPRAGGRRPRRAGARAEEPDAGPSRARLAAGLR